MQPLSALWFAIGVLVVWRVTHLVVAEDGPFDVIVRVRRAAGHGVWGKLLDCFACSSVWAAAPVAWLLAGGLREWALLWPALSAGAMLAQELSRGRAPAYAEDPPEPEE
ncbi:MAG TPA: hypothetical protein VND93_04450 [Myxococcales bacterium]|nr:hypothetical protein [Myxococcales bacterium]